MNACHFSGWIPFAPETRYTPSGRKVICFAARVRDEHGAESILRFQMDGDPVAPLPPELAPGRAVEIEAEATTQAVHRPDGRTVSRLVFHVTRLAASGRRRRKAADSPLQLALF
ncbi:MAG TPA: hypothetical protein VK163_16865 [Opitutaceae bacterium]|nr:hypothetical protein [Opitutaceae bacterium]